MYAELWSIYLQLLTSYHVFTVGITIVELIYNRGLGSAVGSA